MNTKNQETSELAILLINNLQKAIETIEAAALFEGMQACELNWVAAYI